jgi:nicotinamidase-related amidase
MKEGRMKALIVVDAQNEFSEGGLRPVPFHGQALAYIRSRVEEARKLRSPIAWMRHYNKPNESRAFVPGSWGSELSAGFGPAFEFGPERVFEKDVFGAFYETGLEEWLRSLGVNEVLLVGFYTHMCLSTSAREALVRGFTVFIDPDATGAHDLNDSLLGSQTADEVRRAALLHLKDMGVAFAKTERSAEEVMDSQVDTVAR